MTVRRAVGTTGSARPGSAGIDACDVIQIYMTLDAHTPRSLTRTAPSPCVRVRWKCTIMDAVHDTSPASRPAHLCVPRFINRDEESLENCAAEMSCRLYGVSRVAPGTVRPEQPGFFGYTRSDRSVSRAPRSSGLQCVTVLPVFRLIAPCSGLSIYPGQHTLRVDVVQSVELPIDR